MKPDLRPQSTNDDDLLQATMTSQSASADTGAEAESLEDKPFPLLELPVELVLRIFRFAILGSSGRKALRAVHPERGPRPTPSHPL